MMQKTKSCVGKEEEGENGGGVRESGEERWKR